MGACKECGCQDGDRGPMGLQGEKGDTGASGAVGATGPQGPIGPQGVQGNTGPQGIQGPAGNNGANIGGPAGPTGPQGNQGIQGPAGNNGANGTNGLNGANGQGKIIYVINASAVPAVHPATVNEGVVMKNTAFVDVQLPAAPSLGDVVQVVGSSFGTGGWKLIAGGGQQIQMTSQTLGNLITSVGGQIQLAATNYRDVITMMYDGVGTWFIYSSIFANNNIPLFI